MAEDRRQKTGDRRPEAGSAGSPEGRIAQLERQVRELRERNQELLAERAAGANSRGRLVVSTSELPADYKGHLPRRLVVSLRPDLRRRVIALFHHLQAVHATTQHPRYHAEAVHVDSPAHVVIWLLERVALVNDA